MQKTISRSIKRINYITFFVAALLGIIVAVLPTAKASGYDLCEAMLNQIKKGVIGCVRENLTHSTYEIDIAGNMTEKAVENPILDYVVSASSDSATFTKADGSTVSKNDNIINKVFNISAIFGLLLSFVYASGRIFSNMDRGMPTTEAVLKGLREILFVSIFILNIDVIMDTIYQLGNLVVDLVSNAVIEGIASPNIKIDIHKGAQLSPDGTWSITEYDWFFGCFDFIETFLKLVIPWIASYLCEGVALLMCYSLLIEIGIRRAFAPLAIADIFGEGLRSTGARYIKRYFACFLKIAISILVASMGAVFMGLLARMNLNFNEDGQLQHIFSYLLKIVVLNFTIVSVIGKTGEYANDIVGA